MLAWSKSLKKNNLETVSLSGSSTLPSPQINLLLRHKLYKLPISLNKLLVPPK
jgi:hypothetical protein